MKSTKSPLKKKKVNKKPTRAYHKNYTDDSKLTESQKIVQKRERDEFCDDMVKRYDETYSKYYFSNTARDFPRLVLHYKYWHSNEINEKIFVPNFERIERDTTNHIIKSLDQAKLIINSLGKSYKQNIINSNELTIFLMNLLEMDEDCRIKNVRRYEFAQTLFNIAIKILFEEAPVPIKRHMVRSLEDFYDVVELPTQLGYKNDKMLIRPEFKQIEGTNDYVVNLEKRFKK